MMPLPIEERRSERLQKVDEILLFLRGQPDVEALVVKLYDVLQSWRRIARGNIARGNMEHVLLAHAVAEP